MSIISFYLFFVSVIIINKKYGIEGRLSFDKPVLEDNAKLTGKAFDVTEHVSAIMLLKDFTDNKCNYIQTSKGQTVRRMREKTNKILKINSFSN